MRAWVILLGGLTVWAAHFFALYAIGSVFPGRPEARWLSLVVTIPALAANGILLWKTVGRAYQPDSFGRWVSHTGALGAALSLVAVLWQLTAIVMV